jgi:hypothetical protein
MGSQDAALATDQLYMRLVPWQRAWHAIMGSDRYVHYAHCGRVYDLTGSSAEATYIIPMNEVRCGACADRLPS